MTTAFTVEDLENLSTEDFAKLAAQLAQPTDVVDTPAVETPKVDAAKDEVKPDDDTETVYRREIDLGDGAGVQVFEGSSYDDLIDKLANAQLHATRKIRELSKDRKAEAAKDELTPEEEFVLSQELSTKPSKVLKSVFEKMVGMPIEEFKSEQAAMRAFKAAQAGIQSSQQFVQATPDYFGSERNGKRMTAYLDTYKLPMTVENLQKAFADLSESGLLEAKPATNGASDKQDTPDTRIAEADPRTVVTQRRAGSSISTRGRSASQVQKTELTVADLDAMPLDKLEAMRAAYNASVLGA